MTALGRLIVFDQPGTGASDLVAPGCVADPRTMGRQTRSRGRWQAEPLDAAALFAATHPTRTSALVALDCYVHPLNERTTDGFDAEAVIADLLSVWGTGNYQHVACPDMPWNEEIRAAWARMERMTASPSRLAP